MLLIWFNIAIESSAMSVVRLYPGLPKRRGILAWCCGRGGLPLISFAPDKSVEIFKAHPDGPLMRTGRLR